MPWVGAGLLGLIALMAGDLGAQLLMDVPRTLTALLLSLIILAGAALAEARIQNEWLTTRLQREQEDGKRQSEDTPSQELQATPLRADLFWVAALVLTALAGLTALVCVWWFAFR